MLGVGTAVYVVVLVLLGLSARRRATDRAAPSDATRRRLMSWVVLLTAAIVAGVFVLSIRAEHAVHGSHDSAGDVLIHVTGWQYWWEVHYGASDTALGAVVSANEIHIPTGQRVRVQLTSGDVIHSLWIPHLQGKVDLVPGDTNVLWLEAKVPGISRGQCAEYCGTQHTHMALTVVAHAPAEFASWLARERAPAPAPTDSLAQAGAAVFRGAGCDYCHEIRGTNSLGRLGPDLTHVGSRGMLAAGTIENTPENLAAWIVGAQSIKPGNRMPNIPLTDAQLRAVTHYLSGLR
jgi:cytochrome c oxidase subunit II